MPLFDKKNFNGEVFGGYVDRVPNLNRNELLKSGAVVEKKEYAGMLPDQTGGNYITIPIKARIGGEADNYDGNTDITADSRETYTHGRIVIGRSHGWTERDFSTDITGEDFMPAAEEVAEYWDDVDQATLLSILKGIFSMTAKGDKDFVDQHTYDISSVAEKNVFSEVTLNNGIQKALGDNKGKFSLAVMHSQIATNLENLNLLSYMKYTDAKGIERDLTLGTINGRAVLIDDNMPTESVKAKYVRAEKNTEGAKLVKESGASEENEINKSDVTTDIADIKANEYVVQLPEATVYTTYVLGAGAFEYTDVGAKVPYEMDRDPKTKGGLDVLYSRQRKIFSPYGISWKSGAIISPTNKELEDGSKWQLAQNNDSGNTKYFPIKSIPIARIKTRG